MSNRQKRGVGDLCIHDHLLVGENIYLTAEGAVRCVACKSDRARRWNTKNRDLLIAQRSTPEMKAKRAVWMAGYYQDHKDACTRYKDEYVARDPERSRLIRVKSAHTRRANDRNACGAYTLEQWLARSAYFGGRCWLQLEGCTGIGDTIDHVIPLSKGGTNWPANLRPACSNCNTRKGAKTLDALKVA